MNGWSLGAVAVGVAAHGGKGLARKLVAVAATQFEHFTPR